MKSPTLEAKMLSQEQRVKLHQIMMGQLGKSYLFGAKPLQTNLNPSQFDCSGFVTWCYGQLGIIVPDGSVDQFEASVHVDSPLVGDLAFFKREGGPIHHVGMFYDDEFVAEARGEPYNRVITRPRKIWEAWHEFVGWNRFKSLV